MKGLNFDPPITYSGTQRPFAALPPPFPESGPAKPFFSQQIAAPRCAL